MIVDAATAAPAGLGHTSYPFPAALAGSLDSHHIESGTRQIAHMISSQIVVDGIGLSMPKRAKLILAMSLLKRMGSPLIGAKTLDMPTNSNSSSQFCSSYRRNVLCHMEQVIENTQILAVKLDGHIIIHSVWVFTEWIIACSRGLSTKILGCPKELEILLLMWFKQEYLSYKETARIIARLYRIANPSLFKNI
jgi:hypothetical protein